MGIFSFLSNVLTAFFNKCFGRPRLVEHDIDLSTLNSLIGTEAADVDARLVRQLSQDSFTVKMFRKGYLTFETDEAGIITGFQFTPPKNFEMTLTGSAGNDDIVTGFGDDAINAEGGDDTVNAGAGADTITGGAGNDTLLGGEGDDTLEGGDGSDDIDGQNGDDILVVNGNVAGFSFDFVDATTVKITDTLGTLGIDTIKNVENFLFADAAFTRAELEDFLSGPNEITGTSGNDVIPGTAGDDIIFALEGDDTVNAGEGNDTIFGGEGADILYGEGGNDILYGGIGSDSQLFGGTGSDTFAFQAADLGTGSDIIRDFSLADGDKIDLSDLLTAFDPLTDLITDFVRISTAATNSFVAVDVNGGADSFQTIAIIENVTGLTDEQALVNNGTLIV